LLLSNAAICHNFSAKCLLIYGYIGVILERYHFKLSLHVFFVNERNVKHF